MAEPIDINLIKRQQVTAHFESNLPAVVALLGDLASDAGLSEPELYRTLIFLAVGVCDDGHCDDLIADLRHAANLLAKKRRTAQHRVTPSG